MYDEVWLLTDEGFWRGLDGEVKGYAALVTCEKVCRLRNELFEQAQAELDRRSTPAVDTRAPIYAASGNLSSFANARLLALDLARERVCHCCNVTDGHAEWCTLPAILREQAGEPRYHGAPTPRQAVPSTNRECIGYAGCEANDWAGCECAPTATHVTDSVISGGPEPQGDVDVDMAARFAWVQHMGQTRDGGEPTVNHLHDVAALVRAWGGTPIMVAAAWLHDVLEDTDTGRRALLEVLVADMSKGTGRAVWRIVCELTDVYTKESFPHLGRLERKRLEAERIAQCSIEAKVIKRADVASNSHTIEAKGGAFANLWRAETAHLLQLIAAEVDEWRRTR